MSHKSVFENIVNTKLFALCYPIVVLQHRFTFCIIAGRGGGGGAGLFKTVFLKLFKTLYHCGVVGGGGALWNSVLAPEFRPQ